MKPKIIVYLPIIHKGYMQLFKEYAEADIFIANSSLIELIDQEFDYLRKEIRAITPQQAELSLEALLPDRNISLLGAQDISLFDVAGQTIILPKEDIFVWLAREYFSKCDVTFVDTFLRWDRNNSVENKKVKDSKKISTKQFRQQLNRLVEKAQAEASLRSDWWRQVGAVAFFEPQYSKQSMTPKIMAIAHNQHLPSPYTPYIDSDPRNSFHKGEHIERSTAIHAEAAIIAYAAKKGISLDGASMYVSTFPCPVCAKQIAASGFRKLYYSDGYAVLDGQTVLDNSNVEIIKIE